MLIKEIFSKPVDRPIEGVIKANDESGLQSEVEEYVLTREVSKHLNDFLEEYTHYKTANGAWVSGFFGSGKSHLLKMLAFLLENRQINGKSMLEYFLPKCGEDEFLKANLTNAAAIPSRSILFNIDQKSDSMNPDDDYALLEVFVKVFNEMSGYYGKVGYIAQFERDLVDQGLYAQFQEVYLRETGKQWVDDRHLALGKRTLIAKVYSQVTGNHHEHVKDIIKEYREDFNLSIEDFAKMVKEYIDAQGPNFRLNFFVDEVGQYIADDTRLMTNLQTIAESLNTICQGRSWIVVTAQEDMEKAVGNVNQQQQYDFSKIMARFKMRLKLTSANVDEVIAKRLLMKNPQADNVLPPLYHQQKNNLGTFFDFSSGGRTFQNYRHEQHFVNLYPFIPYQFGLFQLVLASLSDHNAFEGRHAAIGERSMLGVFQYVAVEIKERPVGTLASFDCMFTGIRGMLKTQNQLAIQLAEQNLTDEFAVRLLKVLFLVKYVRDFKANLHNLRVLMTESFDQNLSQLSQRIESALVLLEQQTYIQRNGDEYEFLTDEEKDVEVEIKNTEVESGEMLDELKKIIFDGIIVNSRLRHADSGQDFDYTKKVDHKTYGREQELTIQIISPEHEHADNPQALMAMSMGLPVLLVALPADNHLLQDLYLYRKTERYIQQTTTNNASESINKIINEKRLQNQKRYSRLKDAVSELVGRSAIYVNGSLLEISSQDAKTNILTGFNELITRTYSQLSLLHGIQYQESQIWGFLSRAQNELFDQSEVEYNEAQREVLSAIRLEYEKQHRVSLYALVNKFSSKPYGWSLAALQCVIAMLHNRGKLEIRSDSNILEGRALLEALKNTHGFNSVVLEPQIEFTPQQVHALRNFFSDFFDATPAASDGRALGNETKTFFQNLANTLQDLARQKEQYPFLSALITPVQRLEKLSREPYSYFLTELREQSEELLDLKESLIAPIRRFMGGDQRGHYDECRRFLLREEANFSALPGSEVSELRALLDDPQCYYGNKMMRARDTMRAIQAALHTALEQVKQEACREIESRRESLRGLENFQRLSPTQQQQIEGELEQFLATLKTLTLIASVRDSQRHFSEQVFPSLLTRIDRMAAPPPPPPPQPSMKATADDAARSTNTPPAAAPAPVLQTRSVYTLRPSFEKPLLRSEAEVDAYLQVLKRAIMEEIENGNQISL